MLFLRVLLGIIVSEIAIFAYIVTNKVLLPYTPYGKLNLPVVVLMVVLLSSFIVSMGTLLGYFSSRYFLHKSEKWPDPKPFIWALIVGTIILSGVWLFLVLRNLG